MHFWTSISQTNILIASEMQVSAFCSRTVADTSVGQIRLISLCQNFTSPYSSHKLIGRVEKVKVFRYKPGSWGSRRLRLLDLLDLRHYEDGKVVTLTHRPSLPPEFSWYSFLEVESTPGHMVPSVASEKIPSDTTGDRSRDLPTSSAT
jgi:hypothetical protein